MCHVYSGDLCSRAILHFMGLFDGTGPYIIGAGAFTLGVIVTGYVALLWAFYGDAK